MFDWHSRKNLLEPIQFWNRNFLIWYISIRIFCILKHITNKDFNTCNKIYIFADIFDNCLVYQRKNLIHKKINYFPKEFMVTEFDFEIKQLMESMVMKGQQWSPHSLNFNFLHVHQFINFIASNSLCWVLKVQSQSHLHLRKYSKNVHFIVVQESPMIQELSIVLKLSIAQELSLANLCPCCYLLRFR